MINFMIFRIKLNSFSNEDTFNLPEDQHEDQHEDQYEDFLSSMNSTYSEYRSYSLSQSSAVDRSTLNSTESSTMYSSVSSADDMSSSKRRITCHLCNQYLRKVDMKQCACGELMHKKCKAKWKRRVCPTLKWF